MYPNLIAELKRDNRKYEDIAILLEVRIATVNDKMLGKSDFKLKELKKIRNSWFPNCSLDYLATTKEEYESQKE